MNPHKIHFVYLVPDDREEVATLGITRCAQHLQAWYRAQMAGKTFTLLDNVCTVARSPQEALWFSTNNAGGDQAGWYWNNCINEAGRLTGAGFFQPYDDWVIYCDAPLAPGQFVGGAVSGAGWFSGICLLPEEDVLAVQGLPTPHHYSLCREIGGCGHELGHTFGLPHPVGDPNYSRALMGGGYSLYPNCILTESAKTQLGLNPFFEASRLIYPPPGLCPFSVIPARPRPIEPAPRPHD